MAVAITQHSPLFSEYNRGPASYIHMLSKPINVIRDTAIHQDDIDKLKEAMVKSAKHTSTTLVFCGSHNTDKAAQLNQLAYHTNKAVCFVNCQQLVEEYIGETEKNLLRLVAQAEAKNWILYFDEADALFGRRINVKEAHDKYANQEISYLFKRLSAYPGLSILSLTDKSKLENVRYTVDSVITFR